jgi:hypothetical protein
MSSTLISIDDWIDRFGLELVDSDPLVDEAPGGFRLVMSCVNGSERERPGPAAAASNVRRSPGMGRHSDAPSIVRRGLQAGALAPATAFEPHAAPHAPALLQ